MITLTTAGILAVSRSITAVAGEWKQDNGQWQYMNDDGNYANNSYRIDISMTTDTNELPLYYLTQYYKKADGSWEKATNVIEGTADHSLDENGNTILLCDVYGFTCNPTGNNIIHFTKNGDTLQMTMDEDRITYLKQN